MTSGVDLAAPPRKSLPKAGMPQAHKGLRFFSKFTAINTLLLIFIGGMVTSTSSGLAVPDWPLSYGMLFPPMVGGVFYEHGHRMAAAFVGFLTLVQTAWILKVEKRSWVRKLAVASLAAVIAQGLLGGLTVLFFLPTAISVSHGTLAQTFFVLTIILAYSQSDEWHVNHYIQRPKGFSPFFKMCLIVIGGLYAQLLLGAVMRHTGSGLAIYDFPRMAGSFWPGFDEAMLAKINDWRFERNLDNVVLSQVAYHFMHRVGAVLLSGLIIGLNVLAFRKVRGKKPLMHLLYALDAVILTQISLGIATVLSEKMPSVTSLHVMVGAAALGVTALLAIRAYYLGVSE